jgi:isopentenyl diphosphate isomerase/L-lactate dehydrogenase-like FMN-dependent dehydrogenase
MTTNFGDFQNGVYADAVKGKTSRYPFDFQSIQRKASEALPDWVYRYVSAAAGDGRTQRANIAAYSHYGIVPRMMVSPPERDLSIDLFGKHLPSPIFMCPIGLIRLCAPDFQGDVAAAQASAETGVPFTLSTFSQAPMEDVIKHAGDTIPNCDFAEVMVPQNVLSMGMADLPTIDAKGFIAAPQKSGLGYAIDPDKIDELTLKRC